MSVMAVSSIARKSFWRDAATIILPARWPGSSSGHHVQQADSLAKQHCDYKCLMVKRSAQSKFSASSHVYPGGTVSNADYDPRWIDFFQSKLSVPFQDIVASLRIPERRSPMTRKAINGVPADIALRLCAIRETFEEAGILLAQPIASMSAYKAQSFLSTLKTTNAYAPADDSVFVSWRKAIQPDASKFIEMCIDLNVVPNIWSLLEWSNWLTPPLAKVDGPSEKPRRYDTMFYMCSLNSVPHVIVDKQEIVDLKWLSPVETVAERAEMIITTGFPQAYESLRLSNFTKFDDLVNFSYMRNMAGLQRIFGVVLLCTDGFVLVHEGDDHYPEKPDYEGLHDPPVTEKSVAEVMASGTALDRATGSGVNGKYQLVYNLPSHPDGHLPLMKEEEVLRQIDVHQLPSAHL